MTVSSVVVWPLLAFNDKELVVGKDKEHLEFRVAVQKAEEKEYSYVVVSTICQAHTYPASYTCLSFRGSISSNGCAIHSFARYRSAGSSVATKLNNYRRLKN